MKGSPVRVTEVHFGPPQFTGKMRDPETQLDYFGARYFSSQYGRWMSPDWASKPVDVPYAQFGDPQSLDLYSYVGSNPATRRDLDGHAARGMTQRHLPLGWPTPPTGR